MKNVGFYSYKKGSDRLKNKEIEWKSVYKPKGKKCKYDKV